MTATGNSRSVLQYRLDPGHGAPDPILSRDPPAKSRRGGMDGRIAGQAAERRREPINIQQPGALTEVEVDASQSFGTGRSCGL